jgi:hypothetical protein
MMDKLRKEVRPGNDNGLLVVETGEIASKEE